MSLTIDGQPAEHCPVCEEVWLLKPNPTDPANPRFGEHNREVFYKNKLITVPCPGQFSSYAEAQQLKLEEDAQG